MTPEQETLGRRAVVAVGENWRAGMRVRMGTHWGRLVACGRHLIHVSEVNASDAGFPPEWEGAAVLIDVDDPATFGCLWRLVEQAWGEDVHLTPFHTHVNHVAGGDLEPAIWWALASGMVKSMHIQVPRDDGVVGRFLAGPTKTHALVAALEAAGMKTP